MKERSIVMHVGRSELDMAAIVPYTKYYTFSSSISTSSKYRLAMHNQKTNWVIFNMGKPLPFTAESAPELVGNHYFTDGFQDPSTYCLEFESAVGPELFKKFNMLVDANGTYLFDRKMVDIFMDKCPDDIQFFPATIVPYRHGNLDFECNDYYMINICKIIDAIDPERSIKMEGSRCCLYKKIRFHEGNASGYHIGFSWCRLDPQSTLEIVVSPDLVKVLQKAKIKGVYFAKDVDFWPDYPTRDISQLKESG